MLLKLLDDVVTPFVNQSSRNRNQNKRRKIPLERAIALLPILPTEINHPVNKTKYDGDVSKNVGNEREVVEVRVTVVCSSAVRLIELVVNYVHADIA